MLGASAKLVLLYGVGSIVGPILVGDLMRNIGGDGFLIYMIVVHAALGGLRALAPPAQPGAPQGAGQGSDDGQPRHLARQAPRRCRTEPPRKHAALEQFRPAACVSGTQSYSERIVKSWLAV